MSADLDFAVAAYAEDGHWTVTPLVLRGEPDLSALVSALRRYPGETGVLGMVSVDEDFFVLVRVTGSTTRVLLSDVTAADEWEIAQSVIDFLGLPPPEDDDVEVPAGDLDLLADLGLHAIDMGALLDDVELYPDEMLSDIARRLGFGELFDDAIGLASA